MGWLSITSVLLLFPSITQLVSCAESGPLPQLTSPLGPVVNLGYAAYAGNSTSPTGQVDSPVTFFGGVPYAQPPLGDLRFRAPKLLNETVINANSVNITDARNWGPPCVQQPAVVGVGSEDCLNVNIWKPTTAKEGDSLSVAVYIHGGGFYFGTPQGFPMYDWVAQNPKGFIGVSITYRLNLFGFLSGAAVAADGDLNAGLLDQRAALEWIQRHISSFGGDPADVTIIGESAGGASVVMQIVAYGGSKLAPFKRAIAQSIGFGPTPTTDQAEATFSNVASVAGCSTAGVETMTCLRNASIAELVNAINSTPDDALSPIVDGPAGFLPALPSQLITSGDFNAVDFIGGHCSNDGRTFVGGSPTQFVTDDDVRRLVFSRWPGVSNATIDEVLILYPSPSLPGSPFATQYDRAWTIAQEIIFGCMDTFLADKMLAKGVKNVFSYRWNAPDPVLFAAAPYKGVMHTSDLYFLFDGTNTGPNAGSLFTPFNASESVLSTEAIAYWTSFASFGNPSTAKRPTSPAWTQFQESATIRNRIVLTRGTGLVTDSAMEEIPGGEISRCGFWMNTNITAETRV